MSEKIVKVELYNNKGAVRGVLEFTPNEWSDINVIMKAKNMKNFEEFLEWAAVYATKIYRGERKITFSYAPILRFITEEGKTYTPPPRPIIFEYAESEIISMQEKAEKEGLEDWQEYLKQKFNEVSREVLAKLKREGIIKKWEFERE